MNPANRIVPIALALAALPPLHAQESATPQDPNKKKENATPVSNSPSVLTDLVVQGQSPQGAYGAPAETQVTGLPAPIKELPLTVNTLSEQFIADTSARRIRDLIGYVPGVSASDDSGATGDLVNIRGFNFIYQSYINGMRNRVSYDASRRFANIDRIEIFKGPGGVEFGTGDPGGFVNYVTKKPEAVQSTEIGAEAGSYDYVHAYMDSTGPLVNALQGDHGEGVYYRMIVSGDSANSFRDCFSTEGYQVAPSILWKYAEDSSLLFEFDYQYRDQPYDRGIMYIEGAGFKDNFTPINTSYHEPTDYFMNHNTRSSLYWTHKVNDNVTLRMNGEIDTNRGMGTGVRNPFTFLLYGAGNEWNGNPTLNRTTQDFDSEMWAYNLKPEVLLNFETGSVKHTGLFGINYVNTDTKRRSMDRYDLRPIDFRLPVHGQPPILHPPLAPRNFRLEEELEEFGVYYQHKADIGERFHLLGGVRWDWYQDELATTTNVLLRPLPPLSGYSDEDYSGRLGAVVDITDNVSLFAGVSNSFQPQTGQLASGESPDPLEATSIEGGIKANFCDNRLQTTLSIYQTERKNMLELDPTDPNEVFVIPLGTVTISGVEFEATGKLTDELDIMGGFAFMDSEISDTLDPSTRGKNFYNVPDFQAGVRLRYDTSAWLLKGLSLGAGCVYVGERNGDATNSFQLPDYVRFDAGVYYDWRNWSFKLTCENLADETYYLASQGSADIIQPGSPRLVTLGASMKF
ncbi:TonB-dependent siderophore receptor [Luteolibacter soli]|uniref:TonB-dependent receptor n=1 Tax=Luteolibacter soli TaxID=3135280 RepID=A0ABU9AML2_9BACT